MAPCLPFISSASVNMGMQTSFQLVFLFPLDKYPELEFLYLIVALFLIVSGTFLLFHIDCTKCIPTNSADVAIILLWLCHYALLLCAWGGGGRSFTLWSIPQEQRTFLMR